MGNYFGDNLGMRCQPKRNAIFPVLICPMPTQICIAQRIFLFSYLNLSTRKSDADLTLLCYIVSSLSMSGLLAHSPQHDNTKNFTYFEIVFLQYVRKLEVPSYLAESCSTCSIYF